jgi:hypothetical protein
MSNTQAPTESNPASRWQWNCPAKLAVEIDAMADELGLSRPFTMRMIVGVGMKAIRERKPADEPEGQAAPAVSSPEPEFIDDPEFDALLDSFGNSFR